MVLAAAVGLTWVLVGASVAFASFPGRNGRIAFDAARCESAWVQTIRADGSGLRALTRDPCDDERYGSFEPTWAPDGRLFFWSYDFGPPRFVRAGTRRAALRFRKPRRVEQVSFSPGGRHLLYVLFYEHRPVGRDREIWRARVDGSHARRLALGTMPRWSPGGGTIAYVPPPGRPAGNPGGAIWLMNARTGRPVHRVVQVATADDDSAGFEFRGLDWSPDGRKLAYTPDRFAAASSGVFTVRRGRDSRPRRLTSAPPGEEAGVAWSPDGRRIAVVSTDLDADAMSIKHVLSVITSTGRFVSSLWSRTYRFDDPGEPVIAWQPLRPSRRR